MSGKSKWDYLKAIYYRYKKVSKPLRSRILDEFCRVCGYNRKYAIRMLGGPAPQKPKVTARKDRRPTYGSKVITSLTTIWEAAGYPCSTRLKALLPLWLPWAIKPLTLSAQVQKQLLTISPATIDRRLKAKKHQLKKRLYGRTKPGTLLKHHIPIKTDSWDVKTPGFTEIDLVSHSGNSAKLHRRYDKPQTPLDRLLHCPQADPIKTQQLKRLRDQTDPFELAKRMDEKLERLYGMANHRVSPSPQTAEPKVQSPTRSEKQTLEEISKIFAS